MKYPDYSVTSIMEDICYVSTKLDMDTQSELWDKLNNAVEKLSALRGIIEGIIL